MTKSMKRIHKVTIKHMDDTCANTNPANFNVMGSPKRAAAFKNGQLQFIGIRADAEILVPVSEMHTPQCVSNNDSSAREVCICPSRGSVIQHITSGGLWGIGTDSDKSYIQEVEQEELGGLYDQLHSLGFSKRAISAAFKTVQHAH